MFLRRRGNWQNVQTFSEIVTPSIQKLESMCFLIYITPNVDSQYVRDKDSKCTVTQLLIDISNPNNLPREQRSVGITMTFTGTELQVSTKYSVTACRRSKCCL